MVRSPCLSSLLFWALLICGATINGLSPARGWGASFLRFTVISCVTVGLCAGLRLCAGLFSALGCAMMHLMLLWRRSPWQDDAANLR